MSKLTQPDRAVLEDWLQELHTENYLCSECEGLHVNALQALEGVVNSRLFLQPGSILLSTELEVRPMAILPLASEVGRMSMDYPTLKIFLDVVDDATPQLVVTSHILSGQGVTQAQFNEFFVSTMDGTRLLADECLRLDYLFAQADGAAQGVSHSLH